jgi:protein-tyrosine kinase
MGRVDEALRRSNLDAGQGTGAPTPAPEPSPWLFGQPEGGDTPESVKSATEPAGEAPADRPALEEDRFDPRAVERLVVSKTAGPLLLEPFRKLAATLHRTQREPPLKSIIVTSASPGDGKSHVAVNLALTLSDSYQKRVLLIDADLRRPSLHRVFRVPGVSGLSEGLNGGFDEGLPLIRISETLAFLPAGRPVSDPMAGLSSPRMRQIVDEAAAQFDWVIIDTPPVGALADASILSAMVGGSILVVRAGVTPYAAVESAVDALGRDHIIGVLLNAVEASDFHSKGYYYHYYHDRGHDAPGQDTHDQGADH